MEKPKMYSLSKLSELYEVPVSTLRKAAVKQELDAVKVGERAWVATEEAIKAWLPRHRRPGRPKKLGT